jgi:hypothetical protein
MVVKVLVCDSVLEHSKLWVWKIIKIPERLRDTYNNPSITGSLTQVTVLATPGEYVSPQCKAIVRTLPNYFLRQERAQRIIITGNINEIRLF